jgi:bacterioferritin-associated ferredoxin
MDEDVIICRCEGVTWNEAREAVESLRPTTLRQLKLYTRMGMGICQGRTCRPVAEAVARHFGLEANLRHLAYRPPLRPVGFATLSQREPE